MESIPKRIAITGPECAGKTTLATKLHKKYGGTKIDEYARRYLQKIGAKYEQDDLDAIALGQMRQWLPAQGHPIICDSDMTTMLIWSEEKYGQVSKLISTLYQKQNFDLYVLCKPDLPWEAAPLRETPRDRMRLFNLYKSKLVEANRHFVIVDSSNREEFTLETL